MKTIFDHIEYIKGKPHHIRKRVAFTIATIGTASVALIWAAGNISMGAFAIQGSTFADSTGQGTPVTAVTGNANQSIAGAAAALQDENVPAHIEIIDTSSSTRSGKQAEQTIIPF